MDICGHQNLVSPIVLRYEALRVLRRLQRSYQLECYVIEVLPAERGYLRHEAQTLIDAIKYGGILASLDDQQSQKYQFLKLNQQ